MDFLVYNCRPTSTKSRTTKAIRHHLSKSVIINRKQLNFEIFVNKHWCVVSTNSASYRWRELRSCLVFGNQVFIFGTPWCSLDVSSKSSRVESVRFQRKLFTDRLVSLNPATVLAICICTIRNELRLSSTPIGLCKTSGPRRKFSDWIVWLHKAITDSSNWASLNWDRQAADVLSVFICQFAISRTVAFCRETEWFVY